MQCCCRKNNGKVFRWIDRLGIPSAKEGQPSDEELSKGMTLRVTIGNNGNGTLSRPNRGYDEDDEDDEVNLTVFFSGP